eukprot:PhF_6_TR30617/c1_g1_i1/m.45085
MRRCNVFLRRPFSLTRKLLCPPPDPTPIPPPNVPRIEELPPSYVNALRVAFDRCDIDKSNNITPDELPGMLWMTMHKEITVHQANAVVQTMRPGKDRLAFEDFEEFSKANGITSLNAFLEKLYQIADLAGKAVVKTAKDIFDHVHGTLLLKYEGAERLYFPKEVIIVAGPPACGKHTCIQMINQARKFSEQEINVATLLEGIEEPTDDIIIHTLLIELLNPKYDHGVVIRSFPVNDVQAQFLLLLKDWVKKVSKHSKAGIFQVLLLHVDQETSVRRQMEQNKLRKDFGIKCDNITKEIAIENYNRFRQQMFGAILLLRDSMYFHCLDCTNSLEQIKKSIMTQLQYRISLEMSQKTSTILTWIPLANSISLHARQKLVFRLDRYARNNRELFVKVMDLIRNDFMHIVEHQALAGTAYVRSQSSILFEEGATNMLLDVLGERGYVVTMDREQVTQPTHVNLKTGEVKVVQKTIFHFEVRIPRVKIHH